MKNTIDYNEFTEELIEIRDTSKEDAAFIEYQKECLARRYSEIVAGSKWKEIDYENIDVNNIISMLSQKCGIQI